MNIKILDSWLREYLKTKATPEQLAEKLSLTSLSVERLEKSGEDFLYEFEITTNRPDLFSVMGIAREANAILPQFGIESEFKEPELKISNSKSPFPIQIESDPKIVNRICAVVLEVSVKDSPKGIKERLETSGIRSLNNVIDITNYVMRTIGHPSHVFDLDRLNTKKLLIREAKGKEVIKTLDNKTHTLRGGEIVALNDRNEIVDLLGIMGLENSIVTDSTKKILFFIDNNEQSHIRKASMSLGIRTEAATLNEKGIDPNLSRKALDLGIELYEKIADGKLLSEVLDIYPNKETDHSVEVSLKKIEAVLGVAIDLKKLSISLERLGFKLSISTEKLKVDVPSYRLKDIQIEEDVIEEIARIYGYHNLPSILPQTSEVVPHEFVDNFYWEKKARESFKYWGFTEMYTYSFVSEELFEGDEKDAVKLKNPLTEDFVYMRRTIVPSLLRTVSDNKKKEDIKIFELSNVYLKKANDLPSEVLTLAAVLRKKGISFYEAKGYVEQLLKDFGIKNYTFKTSDKSGVGASVYIEKEYIGEIEIFDAETIDFELNFEIIAKNATLKKSYKPLAKFPPVIEDLSLVLSDNVQTQEVIDEIKLKSSLIKEIKLKDQYNDSRTFNIIYQSEDRTLKNEEISRIREKISESLKEKFNAKIK